MNDAHIYKTHKRCYVNKHNPSKMPDIGSVMAHAYIPFKADDGYGPTEIHHAKVLGYERNDIKIMPLDRTSLKCEDTISSKPSSFYFPIYEE